MRFRAHLIYGAGEGLALRREDKWFLFQERKFGKTGMNPVDFPGPKPYTLHYLG
jgi:hypothetical protein